MEEMTVTLSLFCHVEVKLVASDHDVKEIVNQILV